MKLERSSCVALDDDDHHHHYNVPFLIDILYIPLCSVIYTHVDTSSLFPVLYTCTMSI